MLKLSAVSRETCVKRGILATAVGFTSPTRLVRVALSELANLRLAGSREGSSGGYWITERRRNEIGGESRRYRQRIYDDVFEFRAREKNAKDPLCKLSAQLKTLVKPVRRMSARNPAPGARYVVDLADRIAESLRESAMDGDCLRIAVAVTKMAERADATRIGKWIDDLS